MSVRQVKTRYDEMISKEVKIGPDKFNCYDCGDCGHVTKTIDRADGITPFMMECEKCQAISYSSFYEDTEPKKEATWEWVRPSLSETLKFRKEFETLEHILQGGLVIRKIDEAPGLKIV